MLFVVSVSLIFVFFCLHFVFRGKKSYKILALCALALIVVSGFRYYVGVDYGTYKSMYEANLNTGNYTSYIEPIWAFLHVLIHAINGTYVLWFLVVAILTVSGFVYGMQKLSPFVYLSLVFFVGANIYFETFNAVRQYLAMGIIFAGTPFLLNGKVRYFLVSVFLAMMCHSSAIVALALIFFRRRVNHKLIAALLVITIFMGDFLLNRYLMSMINFLGPRFADLIQSERTYELDISAHMGEIVVNSGLRKYVLNIICLYVLWLTRKWKGKDVFYVNCFAVGIMIHNLFITFMEMERLSAYFFMFGMILFPLLVKRYKKTRDQVLVFFFLTLPLFAFTVKSSLTVDYEMNFQLFQIFQLF